MGSTSNCNLIDLNLNWITFIRFNRNWSDVEQRHGIWNWIQNWNWNVLNWNWIKLHWIETDVELIRIDDAMFWSWNYNGVWNDPSCYKSKWVGLNVFDLQSNSIWNWNDLNWNWIDIFWFELETVFETDLKCNWNELFWIVIEMALTG